ncbi:MAG TPA: methyltransferase domain-containing protein [Herpetosiphonaceae bacterium]|nr:methyltransferase domain-containing protein [Herpetosiphonaceae bacterium]
MTETSGAEFGREAGAGLADDELPAYAPMLAAFHRACAADLRGIVAALPLRPGDRVLDMACGDGTYSAWLAERVGPDGRVTGVDLSPAYLRVARERADGGQRGRIEFKQGDIARLPFADGSFDLAWCAHSLYSLPDPLAALRELARVIRPGGSVAILENDTLHHHMLPWPAELELAVRSAQLAALEESNQATGKFYIGRNLCGAFEQAGLSECAVTSFSVDHRAPLSDDERTFLGDYLRDLGQRARPHLDAAARTAFDLLIDPESELYLLDRPDFFSSHLELLGIGRVASG